MGVVTGAVVVEHRAVRCARWRTPSLVVAIVSAVGLLVSFVGGAPPVVTWAFVVTAVLAAVTALVARLLGSEERRCEVRRFRLADESGGQVDCVAVGALAGVEPRAGDHVTVRGKQDRRGILAVRRILVTVTEAGATPRPGIGFWAARTINVVAAALVVVLVVLIGFLILGIG